MFYVYVLKNDTNEIYIGSTNNLKKRMFEHTHKKVYSTKNDNWTLIYYEAFLSEKDAREREHKLKYHGQAKRHLKNRIKHSFEQN